MVQIAQDETELTLLLDQFETFVSETRISNAATPELIQNLRHFISHATSIRRAQDLHSKADLPASVTPVEDTRFCLLQLA
jgi:hypothetical protein